jgi:hypothetical protein
MDLGSKSEDADEKPMNDEGWMMKARSLHKTPALNLHIPHLSSFIIYHPASSIFHLPSS